MDLPDDLKPFYDAAIGTGRSGSKIIVDELFECLLRLRQVREQLGSAPLTVTSERSKMSRCNPLLTVESALRMQFAKLAKMARLNSAVLPKIN